MRLSVIGCGHLGAVHAACMAEIGHDVLGVDVDESKIALLNSGKAWFHEPRLDEMLERNIAARRLRFTTDVSEAATFSQVHFLGVATPGRPDGSYDLSQIIAVIRGLAPYLSAPSLIVGKSTVPPGTAASLRAIAADLAPAVDVDVAWNPEFLREGCAVRDTMVPDRIVIGIASESAAAILREVYRPLTDVGIPLVTTDFATAELVKGAANAFLASKVSFINAMSDICTAVGGDVHTLAEALGMDPRIGKSFLRAGIGYGGACLPKDVRGLAAFAQDLGQHDASELLGIIDAINAARRERVIGLVSGVAAEVAGCPDYELSPSLDGKRLTVWGAAFKPGTDDIRDSPGLDVARSLHALGARVTLYDPMAAGNALAAFPELAYADSAIEAVTASDALLILTAWPEFAEISPADIAAMAGSRVVIDACQSINTAAWREAGWEVLSLTESRIRTSPARQPECVAVNTATVTTKRVAHRPRTTPPLTAATGRDSNFGLYID